MQKKFHISLWSGEKRTYSSQEVAVRAREMIRLARFKRTV